MRTYPAQAARARGGRILEQVGVSLSKSICHSQLKLPLVVIESSRGFARPLPMPGALLPRACIFLQVAIAD